jgi:hypothetical protein
LLLLEPLSLLLFILLAGATAGDTVLRLMLLLLFALVTDGLMMLLLFLGAMADLLLLWSFGFWEWWPCSHCCFYRRQRPCSVVAFGTIAHAFVYIACWSNGWRYRFAVDADVVVVCIGNGQLDDDVVVSWSHC